MDAGFERDQQPQLVSKPPHLPAAPHRHARGRLEQLDLSLFKTLRLNERVSLQLRAEVQDALKHAMFAAPDAAPTNTLFGSVKATIWSEQRKSTAAAKLICQRRAAPGPSPIPRAGGQFPSL